MRIINKLLVILIAWTRELFAAEAGMPQLDPTYWFSQIFWLIIIFSVLYFSIAKFFIPKIKKNLDDRENKIKDDLEDAKNFKEISEKKEIEYINTISNGKKNIIKMVLEAKKKLDEDIKSKKIDIEKDINNEINHAQKEIVKLKNNSLKDIEKMSGELVSSIVKDLSGNDLNRSSVEAVLKEVSKQKLMKYL